MSRKKVIFFLLTLIELCHSLQSPILQHDSQLLEVVTDLYTVNSGIQLSAQCRKDCEIYRNGLLNRELWALHMFDSGSKIQSGFIASGNLGDFGDFDTCINTYYEHSYNNSVEVIRGKYCLSKIIGFVEFTPFQFQAQSGLPMYDLTFLRRLNNTGPTEEELANPARYKVQREIPHHRWAICVPDSCSTDEIEQHLKQYFKVPEYEIDVILLDRDVQTLDSQLQLRTIDYFIIAFFAVIVAFMVLSTIYDTFLHYTETKPAHWILTAFSVLSNGRRLFTVVDHPDMLPCLDGIRFIAMIWIILGHQSESQMLNYNYNSYDAFTGLFEYWYHFIFANLVVIDAFLMIGGLLLIYTFLRNREKEPHFNLIKFYVRRYLRLTPTLLAGILGTITFSRVVGNGPLYHIYTNFITKNCEQSWWTSLLYVANYVNPERICIPPSWYLCADTQLYWISPLILLPIAWFRKVTWYYLSVLLIIATVIPFGVAYGYELQANGEPDKYLPLFHIATHCRMTGWVIGIGIGYIIYQNRKKKVHIPMWAATISWILALICCTYGMLGNYESKKPDYVYDRLTNSLFVVFSTVIFCLGLSWIVFACTHGYGGIVNWFLSLPCFRVLSKLTYGMFISHHTILYCITGLTRVPGWFSKLNLLYSWSGLVVLTTVASLFLTLAFEMPFSVIDTHLFKKAPKKQVTLAAERPVEGTYVSNSSI